MPPRKKKQHKDAKAPDGATGEDVATVEDSLFALFSQIDQHNDGTLSEEDLKLILGVPAAAALLKHLDDEGRFTLEEDGRVALPEWTKSVGEISRSEGPRQAVFYIKSALPLEHQISTLQKKPFGFGA